MHRVIPYTTVKGTQRIVIDRGVSGIDRTKWLRFVAASLLPDGPGLVISAWKELGWRQEQVEKILDIMANSGVSTPRRNGIKCTYLLSSLTLGQVMRRLEPYF